MAHCRSDICTVPARFGRFGRSREFPHFGKVKCVCSDVGSTFAFCYQYNCCEHCLQCSVHQTHFPKAECVSVPKQNVRVVSRTFEHSKAEHSSIPKQNVREFQSRAFEKVLRKIPKQSIRWFLARRQAEHSRKRFCFGLLCFGI